MLVRVVNCYAPCGCCLTTLPIVLHFWGQILHPNDVVGSVCMKYTWLEMFWDERCYTFRIYIVFLHDALQHEYNGYGQHSSHHILRKSASNKMCMIHTSEVHTNDVDDTSHCSTTVSFNGFNCQSSKHLSLEQMTSMYSGTPQRSMKASISRMGQPARKSPISASSMKGWHRTSCCR